MCNKKKKREWRSLNTTLYTAAPYIIFFYYNNYSFVAARIIHFELSFRHSKLMWDF